MAESFICCNCWRINCFVLSSSAIESGIEFRAKCILRAIEPPHGSTRYSVDVAAGPPPPRTTRLGRPENKIALLFAAYIFFVAKRTNQDGRLAGNTFLFLCNYTLVGTRGSQ